MSVLSERNRAKTHCINGHAFTRENTKTVDGRRICRECQRFWSRQYVRRVKPNRQTAKYRRAYQNRRNQMISDGTWQYRAPKVRASLSRQILDVLALDGGWLTTDGIALQVIGDRDSINRTLYRLLGKGLVAKREVSLARIKNLLETRLEWRSLTSLDDLR